MTTSEHRIPQDFIDTVMSRADIVSVIEGAGVKLRKAGRDYSACCPFHEEKSPSFTVSPAKQFYHCFGCGAHGSALGFLMDYRGESFIDALKNLAGGVGMTVPERQRQASAADLEKEREAKALRALLDRARKHFCMELRASPLAIDYAKSRGLVGATAAQFGIGFASGNLLEAFKGEPISLLVQAGLVVVDEDTGQARDKFRRRLMFPICDESGRVIGFGGRLIGDGKPKYLNSPESPVFHKGLELYGLWAAKQAIRQSRIAVVLEGYMDVVMLHQYGEARAVASLGTAFTADQVRRLYRMADEIIFCFDGDAAGQRAADRAARVVLGALADGKSARFVVLPAEHDPDSYVQAYGLEAWQKQLVDGGSPLSSKVVSMLCAGRDPALPESAAVIAAEAMELAGLVTGAPLFRAALVRRMESVLGFALDGVAAAPAGPGQAPTAPESDEIRRHSAPLRPLQRSLPNRFKAVVGENREADYRNLATLCAFDIEAVSRVPLEILDDTAREIIQWFARRDEEMGPSEVPPVLEAVIEAAVTRARALADTAMAARQAEVSGLVEALARSGEVMRRRQAASELFA